VGKNTELGWDWHLIGQQVPNFHVYVLYVGGFSFDGDPSTFGEGVRPLNDVRINVSFQWGNHSDQSWPRTVPIVLGCTTTSAN
jgi:hypothetical protein